MNKRLGLIFGLVLLSACTGPDERIEIARQAARDQMRDPDSAEFRNERIRTIWSDQGDRKIIYCGEVNGNNAFGGKAGFRPFMYQFEVIERGVKFDDWDDRKGFFREPQSTRWYRDCLREDTQRESVNFRANPPEMSSSPEDAKAEVDKWHPVLSLAEAPD